MLYLFGSRVGNEEYAGKEHKQTYAGTPVRHCKQPALSNQTQQGNQSRPWGNARATGTQFSQNGQANNKPFHKIKSEPVTQSNNQLQNQVRFCLKIISLFVTLVC